MTPLARHCQIVNYLRANPLPAIEKSGRPKQSRRLHTGKKWTYWSPEDDAQILAEVARNPRGYAIALVTKLGRTQEAIRSRYRKLSL